MAYHLVKSPTWNSGAGTPPKYTFHLDVYVDVVSVVGNTATISVRGSYGVTNYSTNTSNVQKASDFALVTPGDADAWNYQFTPYQEYYQAALPVIPNAPSSVSNRVILEFRGDTWRSDPQRPGNSSSLWLNGAGLVLDKLHTQNDTRMFNINTTFQINVANGDVPILAYVSSGWEPGPLYEWLDHEVLVSWFQLDYRPGQRKINGNWASHNRGGGAADRIGYGTMRTVDGGSGTNNPPSRKTSGTWYNQRKIGAE